MGDDAVTVKTWNKQALDGLMKGGKLGSYSLGYNSLSFRVAKTGASWVWQARVDGKPSTFVIGHYPNISLVRAREIATEMVALRDAKQYKQLERYRLGSKAKGTIKPTRARSSDDVMIVKDAWELYIEELRATGKNKESTVKDKVNMFALRMEKQIGLLALAAVDHEDLMEIVDDVREDGKMAAANAFIAYAGAFFGWCVTDGRKRTGLTLDPTSALKKTKANSRERVLSQNEIKYLWAALEDEKSDLWRDGYRLAAMTALRRREVFGLSVGEILTAEVVDDEIIFTPLDVSKTGEIDLNSVVIELPEGRTKNGRPHLVPCGAGAAEILVRRAIAADGGFLFQSKLSENPVSGFSKAHARIAERMNDIAGVELAGWVLHDLRRTVSTGLNGLLDAQEMPLIQPATVEALLNHVSGAQAGVAGTYNRHAYFREKRRALRLWEERLTKMVK